MDQPRGDLVTVDEAPLTVEELLAVVQGAQVALGPAARARIEASRKVVDHALATGERVYGVTTGVGPRRTRACPTTSCATRSSSWS